MASKRKADCTPEEWERRLEYSRCYKRSAPPEVREKIAAGQKAWKSAERRRGTSDHQANGGKDTAYQAHLAWNRAYGKRIRAKERARKNAPDLYTVVLGLIPFALEDRFDIASEAMVLLLEATTLDPAEAVKLGRKAHFRKFSRFGAPISLDAPLPGGQSRYDLLAAEDAA